MDIVLSKNGFKYAILKISDVQIILQSPFLSPRNNNVTMSDILFKPAYSKVNKLYVYMLRHRRLDLPSFYNF